MPVESTIRSCKKEESSFKVEPSPKRKFSTINALTFVNVVHVLVLCCRWYSLIF